MMMLDKHLARCAPECRRLDADHWELALANGHALAVSVRHDDGFLLLDAPTGVTPAPDRLVALLEGCGTLPAAVKYALCRGSSAVRLRAEFPLPEEGAADRIRQNLAGIRSALDRLHASGSCEPAAESAVCPDPEGDRQAVLSGLPELLKEAGWNYHERPGGTLLADLETGSHFFQAEVDLYGAGARFRVELHRGDNAAEALLQALCLYLLEANAALRFTRGFLERAGEHIAAGFEVRLEDAPTPAEAAHALAAVSVACRHCAKEMEVLKDAALAGIYRSARCPSITQEKELDPCQK